MKSLFISNIPIIIGLIVILVLYEENIMSNDAIGIIIALITVAGTIFVNYINSKKDGNTIGLIKSDTSEIKPKIDSITEDSKELNNYIQKEFKSEWKLQEIRQQDISNNIKELYDEHKYRKRLEKQYGQTIVKDSLIVGIDKLYENNAVLSNENYLIKKEYQSLKESYEYAQSEIEVLKKENLELKEYIDTLEKSNKEKDYGIEL